MSLTASHIRTRFIEFFKSKPGGTAGGHTFVPSSPCVPLNDPTLLFTNAGMNQFKPVFLGTADPKSDLGRLKRAVNTQKCIRAGGKHNDLDDVGKDTYHHTFFEMLGNWSFGDYFKKEAIEWAWGLLTKEFGIAADRLYATYFGGDEASGLAPDTEARDLWLKFLPPSRVLPGSMKDNFWEMGDTGPCGPCSEIHYDRIGNRDASIFVNTGDPDVLEIWNLVFIQFNREGPTSLRPLPAKHVDTGMGFERLVSVLQNKRSNYDTDVFAPIFAAIQRTTGARPYAGKLGAADEGNIDTAYRVIADHLRTLTFAITDGAVPSNDGRGYVLRRILRRAVRYGRQMMNAKTGFFADLVPVVVDTMGEAFPELRKEPERVRAIIREEEESFGRTLDNGIARFELAARKAGHQFIAETGESDPQLSHKVRRYVRQGMIEAGIAEPTGAVHLDVSVTDWTEFESEARPVIRSDDAFQLYDTFGFPLDLTIQMAEERGLKVDVEGFERLMEEQRERSRSGAKELDELSLALDADSVASLQKQGIGPTRDEDKFHGRVISARVRAIWNGSDFDRQATGTARSAKPIGLILDKTNFYAEMGGQQADHGRMDVSATESANPVKFREPGEFRVRDVQTFGGYILHIGHMHRGEIRVGDQVMLVLDDSRRRAICANHTATHLLNLGLRKTLGGHADQKGSLVAPDRLRFDFSHNGPVTPEQSSQVEQIVRDRIRENLTIHADLAPLARAKSIRGLRAVFGEAYPDPVRVVSIGRPVGDVLANPEHEAWESFSIELCGGTHAPTTGAIGSFAIISETGIAKGIRRVEAVTGREADAAEASAGELAKRIATANSLDGQSLAAEVSQLLAVIDTTALSIAHRESLRASLGVLQDRVKEHRKIESLARARDAASAAKAIAEHNKGQRVIVDTIDTGGDRKALQQALATIQASCPDAAVMLLSPDEAAVAVIAGVPKAMIEAGLKAGDWVREVSSVLGGKGGGRPDQAQGGGSEVGNVAEATAKAQELASAVIK